eukprot:COSAG01_NODE_54647_length_330_cov_3.692641_1_plen_24_part_01
MLRYFCSVSASVTGTRREWKSLMS